MEDDPTTPDDVSRLRNFIFNEGFKYGTILGFTLGCVITVLVMLQLIPGN